MRTPAQIEASRRNGAKSKGPITVQGQARSSRNAIKHGLSSNKIVILDGESEEAWEKYQTHFIAKFQPRDFVEERLVIQMAVNQWRLERVWSLQTATVDQESATQEELVAASYEEWDTALVHACSYNARKLDLKALDGYESRFVRNFDRALKQFNQIREQYPPQLVFENEPKTEILENEPGTEISEQAAVESEGSAQIADDETLPPSNFGTQRLPVEDAPGKVPPSVTPRDPKNAILQGRRLVA